MEDEKSKESALTWAKAITLDKEALKAAEMAKEVGTKEKAN